MSNYFAAFDSDDEGAQAPAKKAPPKKKKEQTKKAPVAEPSWQGDDRGGGGGRGRPNNNDRNTRGGRGGRVPARDGKRAYDRRSGTGWGRETKKGGGGAHNWGSDSNDAPFYAPQAFQAWTFKPKGLPVLLLLLVLSGLCLVTEQDFRTPWAILASLAPNSYTKMTQTGYISLTPCRISLEQSLRPLQEQWLKNGDPILQALVTVGNVHYVLFNVKHNKHTKRASHFMNPNTHSWLCNENEVGQQIAADGDTLVVACTQSSTIESISLMPPHTGPTDKSSSGVHVKYNTTELFLCQEEIYEHEWPPMATIGACTSVAGDKGRSHILEWVEYHRLIGVDHFWIYLNEPQSRYLLEAKESLPQRPYITYIPYDYPGPDFITQSSIMNECLYRSRVYGIEWLGLHDLDEFFHITMPAAGIGNRNGNNHPTLLDLIESFPLTERESMQGVSFLNVFYGSRGGTTNGDNVVSDYPPLQIDHVLRHPNITTGGRMKMLIRPKNVQLTNVHVLTSGGKTKVLHPCHQGYMHHYKLSEQGVYDGVQHDFYKEQEHTGESLVTDSSLRDAFRDKLVLKIKEGGGPSAGENMVLPHSQTFRNSRRKLRQNQIMFDCTNFMSNVDDLNA